MSRSRLARALGVVALVALIGAGWAMARASATNVRLGEVTYGFYSGLRLENGYHHPIYVFTHDGRDRSRCFANCALVFTPVTTHAGVRPWNGVKQKLLGVIKRAHGVLQVTYNHHPLYTASDDYPDDALHDGCQHFGGSWYVIGRNGAPDKRANFCPMMY